MSTVNTNTMKLRDILEPQRIDEISLKQAIAAGMIGAAAMSPRTVAHSNIPRDATHRTIPRPDPLIQKIIVQYNVEPQLAKQVVSFAHKYAHPDFPTAKDIVAVVGIESSFKPEAKSQLKRDPARGLMQVRAGVWNLDPEELHNVENNIKHGADILHQYYKKLKSKTDAIQAYNVGITDFRKGVENPNYLSKYQREYGKYSDDQSI